MDSPLKTWRDENKLTQVELGRLLGVDGMTVSRWERGSHLPNKRHWGKIKETTGIPAAALVEYVREGV